MKCSEYDCFCCFVWSQKTYTFNISRALRRFLVYRNRVRGKGHYALNVLSCWDHTGATILFIRWRHCTKKSFIFGSFGGLRHSVFSVVWTIRARNNRIRIIVVVVVPNRPITTGLTGLSAYVLWNITHVLLLCLFRVLWTKLMISSYWLVSLLIPYHWQ